MRHGNMMHSIAIYRHLDNNGDLMWRAASSSGGTQPSRVEFTTLSGRYALRLPLAGPQTSAARCDYYGSVLKARRAATTKGWSSKRCALRPPRDGPQSAVRCDYHRPLIFVIVVFVLDPIDLDLIQKNNGLIRKQACKGLYNS
ncbi:hypothetical protein ElyMa_003441300 [Elysia marginata]|uniref:Uncharacterized protein n=1 Tax=Elysia marginata TaxID=1093978 RepID=A0AAV4JVM1_9GAST|nr:hypothetical protein ElyMa_003441300 [Elysia marginata]